MTIFNGSTLYILTTPALPGLVKVGFTTLGANNRANQINKQYAFFKNRQGFKAVFEVPVSNGRKAEALAHSRISEHRLPAGQIELFKCSVDHAKRAILLATKDYSPRLVYLEGVCTVVNSTDQKPYLSRAKTWRSSVADWVAETVRNDIQSGALAKVTNQSLLQYSTSSHTREKVIQQLVREGVLKRQNNGRVSIAA